MDPHSVSHPLSHHLEVAEREGEREREREGGGGEC